MQRYRIDLAYDGTAYGGWQVQPNVVTVQAMIQDAVRQFAGQREKIVVHGSGRTDQGVHARRQVAHFDLDRPTGEKPLCRALNGMLPPDIRIVHAKRVNDAFHARRSARAKEYRYFIWTGAIVPPFLRFYRTHCRRALDVAAMQEAADELAGEHDFAGFAANAKREMETTVRTVTRLSVQRRRDEIVIRARANGFLYKMVRSMTGFLIRVGEGALEPSTAGQILHAATRTARVPTAPPQGLFLWSVRY